MASRRRAASAPITWRSLPPATVEEAVFDLSALRAAYDEHLAEGARLRIYLDSAIRRIEVGRAMAKKAAA